MQVLDSLDYLLFIMCIEAKNSTSTSFVLISMQPDCFVLLYTSQLVFSIYPFRNQHLQITYLNPSE